MDNLFNSIKLQTTSILHVPLQKYENNFTFIVNNEEYHTNRLVADILSPKIAKLHSIDVTMSEYAINTHSKGDFQKILNLALFETQNFSKSEISFVIEILENLENTTKCTTVDIDQIIIQDSEESSTRKVLKQLQNHLEFPHFYEKQIKAEIDQISSQFYELTKEDKEILLNFEFDVIEGIISNSNLQIESEDDLVDFINRLYSKDSKFSSLYSYVYFTNVSSIMMKEFVDCIFYEDINSSTWKSLSACLSKMSDQKESQNQNQRYRKRQEIKQNQPTKTILYENRNFSGLISYMKKEMNIKDEIDITCSSIGGNPSRDPWSIISFDDSCLPFFTKVEENPWICFEFKRHEINPSNYTIKSGDDSDNPKSFVLEGSKDKNEWITIGTENNCSNLKEKRSVHTFPVQNETNQSFKFLRLRHVGPTWSNQPRLQIESIEFYGELI